MKCGSEVEISGEGEETAFTGIFDGKLQTVKTGVAPYGFALKRDLELLRQNKLVTGTYATKLKSIKGSPVVKFTTNKPYDVAKVREWMQARGRITFECDIPYVRRVFTDKVFEVEYWNDRVLWIDVEIDDRNGLPMKYGKYPFLSVSASFDGKSVEFWNCRYNERDKLEDFMRKVYQMGKSVFVGWNVGFDFNHLKDRLEKLGLDNKYLKYCFPFDMREIYKRQYRNKGLSTYSLKEVAEREKIPSKEKPTRVGLLNDEELERYNRHDVEILLELEKKQRLIETRCKLHELVSLPLSMDTIYQLGDTEVLRRVRELGYVAPNSKGKENAGYKGAYVQEPKEIGRIERVAVLDVSGMYPTAILEKNIDIANFGGKVMPYLVRRYLKMKDEASERRDYVGREVAKVLANGIGYGLFGFGTFRFFEPLKAKMIVDRGRAVLFLIRDYLEKKGVEILYSDTDSAFVKYGNEDLDKLLEEINEKFKPYRISLDTVFKWIIFFVKRAGEGGAKKRYAGLTKDGELKVRGLELRRGDWCSLTKEVLKESIMMIGEKNLSENDLIEYWNKVKRDLYAGRYDKKLLITQSVKSEYEKPPRHYKAYLEAIEKGKIPKDAGEITYVMNAEGEPVAWDETEKIQIGYTWYWEHQIYPPLKTLVESCFGRGRQQALETF